MKNAIHMICMIARVMHYKGYVARFQVNQRIRQNLDRIVKSQANQKKLSDAIITVRNDRNVIPVKAEYRQDFKGIVHDLPLVKPFILNRHLLLK